MVGKNQIRWVAFDFTQELVAGLDAFRLEGESARAQLMAHQHDVGVDVLEHENAEFLLHLGGRWLDRDRIGRRLRIGFAS
jgi:hypothetical protein